MVEMNARAQIALYDCMFAVFIFVIVFAGFTSIHNQNFQTGQQLNRLNEMKHLAHNAIEVLVGFGGEPPKWSAEDVEIIGLVERERVLNEGKVAELAGMDYNSIKSLLLFGKYDFLLEIDSEKDVDDVNVGKELSGEATVIKVERSVLYKEALADVKLSVFE